MRVFMANYNGQVSISVMKKIITSVRVGQIRGIKKTTTVEEGYRSVRVLKEIGPVIATQI